ncbi:hypothetical protein ABL78_3992 [Leptomonas seymouri]|uniref:Cilia- and flagella-associated protein 45 n=1 Tax=Leptomonas seymouri TaxID=5684 RepID=A0A0N0P5W7_LEPSE|nr:hypothetical protein ABL78_3992 [Leptomonas seymouri]|eukprot:KPI86946.1 hypothetical protein ABL78_3992 [Leptomonas seymouri]
MVFFSSKPCNVFPPRRKGQSDGVLRKELNARGAPRDSAIITATELDIIRGMIEGSFPGALRSPAETAVAPRTHTDAAEERRQKMLEFDAERARSGAAPKTAEEIERAQEIQLNLEKARLKLDEEFDEVKAMNRIIAEAKCVATRETQLQEKRMRAEEEATYNRQMDALMAQEAEKAQQVYLERERQRLEEQRRNTATIKMQMRERDVERVQRLERHQQEQEAMNRHMERLHEERRADKLRKMEVARRMMEEAAIANADQIALKHREREVLIEEERKMAEYLKQKEAREEAYAQEQARIRHEKEMEVARLRANQQRVQDKQTELEELRARRVQEAYVREARRKEKEAAEREANTQIELQRARLEQMEERQRAKALERVQEQEEVERMLAVQKVSREQDLERQARVRRLQEENSLALLKQIMDVEERRRRERQEVIEEGNHIRKDERERKAALEAIRDRKLGELEEIEAPEQYRRALLRSTK